MDIIINDKKITLKKSFRSLIAYEKAKGEMFNPTTITDIILYLYCVIISSDDSTELSFDDFIDYIDNNPSIIKEFSEWMAQQDEQDAKFSKKKVTRKKEKVNQ